MVLELATYPIAATTLKVALQVYLTHKKHRQQPNESDLLHKDERHTANPFKSKDKQETSCNDNLCKLA